LCRYKRNLIAQACYSTILINLLVVLVNIWRTSARHKIPGIFMLLEAIGNYWLLFNCLIQPTSNLLVFALWQVKESLLTNILALVRPGSLLENTSRSVFFYIIVRQMCFFSQGNSNSLNTLQVSSGLIGLNEMNMFVSGLLMFCATYSSNFYWCTITLKHLIHEKLSDINFNKYFEKISSFLQREHLFVWSVFAPRLIYQLASLLTELGIMFYVTVIYFLV